MQAKFTRQAKAALQIAENAARSWKHSYIGTEHILVGLLKEQEGTAGKILEEFGVDPEKLETLITHPECLWQKNLPVIVREPKRSKSRL